MKSPQVLVIGIDGLPYSLMEKLAANGVTPNLKQLMQDGSSKSILSSIPDISSTAWTGFMTGTNPGEHGIYGFFEPDSKYRLKFTNFVDIKSEPIWKTLETSGKKSLIVNIPQTYPAQPMNGAIVSGFVAPDLSKSVYPSKYLDNLINLGYEIDVDAWLARTNQDHFFEGLFRVLEKRQTAVRYLWDKEEWDFVTVVFTGTDRMQHYFWNAIQDRSQRFHQTVLDFYHAVDQTIGNLVGQIDDSTTVIMLSDHGFTGVIREVNLNAWLREQGLLTFRTEEPESLEEIDDSTAAFSIDPGRIYLNRSDRFSQGWIKSGDEFEHHRDELKGLIERELVIRDDTGNVVNPIDRIVYPEAIYSGPYLDRAPDLIVLAKPGFDLKGSVRIREVARKDVLTGVHTRRDASLIVRNPNAVFDFSAIETIEDIASQILKNLDSA